MNLLIFRWSAVYEFTVFKSGYIRCFDIILNECAKTGVKGVIDFGMGLTLREGDREYYYTALDRYFPGLKKRYMERYGNAYELPSPNAKELTNILHHFCKENGIMSDPEDCFAFMNDLPEKTLR